MGKHRAAPKPKPPSVKIALTAAVVVSVCLTVVNLTAPEPQATPPIAMEPQARAIPYVYSPLKPEPTNFRTPTPEPTTTIAPPPTTQSEPEPTIEEVEATTTTTEPKPKPKKTTEEPPPPPPEPKSAYNEMCEGLGVKSHVEAACHQIASSVPGISSIGGRADRPNNPTSCHPRGLALDFMTSTSVGNEVNAYVKNNKSSLGATTLLWQVAAHYDHVHVSFAPCNH